MLRDIASEQLAADAAQRSREAAATHIKSASSRAQGARLPPDFMIGFLVSTGTWQHPTVLGSFKVYVKYRYADMSGPDYYLPDVPYVMYFYKGYGLHGTYWHSNFGTPMSHGCVNLPTGDAGWLFDWASVGTVVNVHE